MVLAAVVGCGNPRTVAHVGALYPANHPLLRPAREAGLIGDSATGPLQLDFPQQLVGEESGAVLTAIESFSAERRLVAVVGPAGSRGALAAAALLNARGIPHIVPNATSDLLAEAGPWTFALAPGNRAQGQLLADFAADSLRGRRIAIVHVNDEYGIGLRDGVAGRMGARGLSFVDEVVVQAAAMTCTAPPVRESMELVARALVARAHPDVVILGAGVTVGGCLAAVLLANDPAVRVLAGDGLEFADPEIRKLPPAARARFFTVVMWEADADSVTLKFRDAAQKLWARDPTPSEALVYDAFGLLAAAVTDVGTSRVAVRRWLQSLGRERPPWRGVTGSISFVPGARNAILHVRGAAESHD